MNDSVVFADGGRQVRAQVGETVDIDLRDGLQPGNDITFDRVLFVRDAAGAARIGTPTVPGARVVAKVVGHVQGPKLVVQHFRRRKNSRVRTGHRQRFTRVEIARVEG